MNWPVLYAPFDYNEYCTQLEIIIKSQREANGNHQKIDPPNRDSIALSIDCCPSHHPITIRYGNNNFSKL